VLDLGCGTGIVAVVLAKLLPADAVVCASDLSTAAVALARRNAERNGIAVQCRSGSLFDPWCGQRFNLIVDDVAGVAEPLDRLSGWYPPAVPSEAGSDGTRWVLEILDQAPDFLAPGGLLIFPVLTLSREQLVTERARSRLGADDAKRLKQLGDENRRLKKIVADQTLDMQILKEVLGPRRAPKRNCPGRRSGRGSFILRRVLVTSRALSRCRTKRCGACART
jgi:methylase of polypeptide subunit release factors